MAKLTFETRLREGNDHWSHNFGHEIIYIAAGGFKGGSLNYDEPGGGSYVADYDNQLAAWKTLSLAIQGTKSLVMVMPRDAEIESYYRKHTQLADAINIEIVAYNSRNSRGWESHPDQSIGLFDVTVLPSMPSYSGVTVVGLQFSGATKEYF
jgi:hypothetical protein